MAKAKHNTKGAGRKTNLERMLNNKQHAETAVDFIYDELENLIFELAHDMEFPEIFVKEKEPDIITEKIKAVLNNLQTSQGKGILLIAGGHPYYGQMAANLAASLKLSDPGIKIHLCYHGDALKHLDANKISLFNSMSVIPESYLLHNGKISYFKAKTHIYDLSPFEETIFLDADMVWLTQYPVGNVFTQLAGVDFTISNRERYDLTTCREQYQWAELSEIKAAYEFTEGFIYGLHSEFIYFKKTDRVKEYFETVKEIYSNPKVKVFPIGGTFPDELAFAIASVIHKIYPHVFPFVPIYWYFADSRKGTGLEYVAKNYMAYSIGGSATPEVVRNRYDLLMRSYGQRMALKNIWKSIPKKKWLTERANEQFRK